ncbi:hypothetical protein INR49_026851 [Caranx melampygus]|nr:hypothetical protein INR49_026851 [Caranx melampygus]
MYVLPALPPAEENDRSRSESSEEEEEEEEEKESEEMDSFSIYQLSGDFSQYQLAGLLQRNKLNQRLESVEKEMSQRSAGSAPQLYQQEGDEQDHSVESRRLVSEDNSHYILIKALQRVNLSLKTSLQLLPGLGSPVRLQKTGSGQA